MKLSSIINILAIFTLTSGILGVLIWNYNGFYFLLVIGVGLAFLDIVMEGFGE